jgi:hypothetical protein
MGATAMPEPSGDPIQIFDHSIGLAAQAELLRTLADKYPAAYLATRSLVQDKEVRDLWPDVRRGMIEGAFRDVAARHGLVAHVKYNTKKNSHTVIEGTNFLLTQSVSTGPKILPRSAVFRTEDALHNQPLFANLEENLNKPDAKYSAIIIHGPSLAVPVQLGFARVVFPGPDGLSLLDISINLMSRFADVIASVGEFKEEIIPDLLTDLKFRTDQDEEQEGGG